MTAPLKKRPLGSSGVEFSPLTLGTVKFGRNQSVKYPNGFHLPDDQQLTELLNQAQQAGITTLDTAPAYGIAEERLGKLIQHNRDSWQIISKAGEFYNSEIDSSHYDYSAKALEKSLESSLKKLNTSYLDCWMIHSDGNDLDNLNDDILNVLLNAKQRGLTRSIGMSTKTVVGGQLALQHLDCIMMTASLDNTSEQALFTTAKELGKGLLLKKIYDSGWALTNDNKLQVMQKTLNSVFQHPAVCSAIIGTINPKHLEENIQAYLSCDTSNSIVR